MSSGYDSDLAKKLNLKSGTRIRVLARPEGVHLSGVATTDSADADGILVFVRKLAEVAAVVPEIVDAVRRERITWIAYPKAGQLGTDLNRDILWRRMLEEEMQGVRQIALDDVWSAMRFRRK